MALTDVVGAGPVGVNTALFIYLIEEHPRAPSRGGADSRPSWIEDA